MQRLTLKAFLTDFNKVVFILALGLRGTGGLACGGADWLCEDACSSYFMPEVIGDDSEIPFFLSTAIFYGIGNKPQPNFEKDNLAEWSKAFNGKISLKDLKYLVYKLKLADLDQVIFFLKGQTPKLSSETKALATALKNSGKTDFAVSALYYLGFAKRVEPSATARVYSSEWEEPQAPQAKTAEFNANIDNLIKNGEKATANTVDPFLKPRYQFQILRLYFYTQQYAQVVKLYDQHRDVLENASPSIRWRSLELAAGSQYHNKNFGVANYLSSLIYANYAPLKMSAYLTFNPQEQSDWVDALGMAKNSSEKEYLYQLLGIRSNDLATMQQLYALNPKSRMLNLLLVRQVNLVEEYIHNNGQNTQTINEKLLPFARKTADAENTAKPFLWHMVVGHLYAITGSEKDALNYLARAAKMAPNDRVVQEQIRMSRLYAKSKHVTKTDLNLETYFAKELAWLGSKPNSRAENFAGWAKYSLSDAYMKLKGFTWAFMLVDQPADQRYQDNKNVDALIKQQNNPRKSIFEDFMVKNYGMSQDHLFELEGINLLYEGKFRDAANKFVQIKKSVHSLALRGDPFIIHIVDCHDCDEAKGTKMDKEAFARQMAELSEKAKGTEEDSAIASFQYANGLYNMTFFGNGRAVYETSRGNFDEKLPRNRNMEPAEKYYLRAASLSKNPELQAQATYMAAKADFNRYIDQTIKYDSRYMKQVESNSGKHFATLKERYQNTKYYQEILAECSFFADYVNGHKRK